MFESEVLRIPALHIAKPLWCILKKHKMIEYPYQHDSENLEIVPKEIWTNPMIVFHGTTTYHSENIEKNGLIINTPPYNIDHVKILVGTLKSNDFSKFDTQKGFFKWTTAFGIEHYLDAIQKKEFRISFSPLSSACVAFTTSATKGGQAFRDIREAKQIIDSAINYDNSIASKIPNEINLLFNELEKVNKSHGVVYAIKLPDDLNGIECNMNNVIYSTVSIPKELIIGKVIIPDSPVELQIMQTKINDKIKTKLHTNGGLAIRIWNNQK